MKYNRPHATATWGTMAKDWEAGVDMAKLNRDRVARAQAAIKNAGLGAVLCFNMDNTRYLTATHIGEWARDKFDRYALCATDCEPYLWDPARPSQQRQGRSNSPNWLSGCRDNRPVLGSVRAGRANARRRRCCGIARR